MFAKDLFSVYSIFSLINQYNQYNHLFLSYRLATSSREKHHLPSVSSSLEKPAFNAQPSTIAVHNTSSQLTADNATPSQLPVDWLLSDTKLTHIMMMLPSKVHALDSVKDLRMSRLAYKNAHAVESTVFHYQNLS